MVEVTGEGRACIPVGLTKTWDGLVNYTKCIWKVEKKSKKKPWLDLGCLEPAAIWFTLECLQSLPGGQAISYSYFHVFVSIGP